MAKRATKKKQRVVIKIGSAILAPDGELDHRSVDRLAGDIASVVLGDGCEVVIVSSGAIASGFSRLGLKKPPKTIMLKQAAAAVGQSRLMRAWGDAFERHGICVAQVLLTGEDVDQRERNLNAKNTLATLLERGVVPIVNENDSVSFAEIKLGDNDRLSALVAGLVQAQELIILSTARGLYEKGDARRVIPQVRSLKEARLHVQGGTSNVGTGGMATKLDAVATAGAAGVPTVIAGGEEDRVVQRVMKGEQVGTRFPLSTPRVRARKRWIGFAAKAKGLVMVDEGACKAIVSRGASLLPSGVVEVRGEFGQHAVVDVCMVSEDGGEQRIARGVIGYSSEEMRRIAGCKTSQIAGILGYVYADEVIHRDNLALLGESAAEGS